MTKTSLWYFAVHFYLKLLMTHCPIENFIENVKFLDSSSHHRSSISCDIEKPSKNDGSNLEEENEMLGQIGLTCIQNGENHLLTPISTLNLMPFSYLFFSLSFRVHLLYKNLQAMPFFVFFFHKSVATISFSPPRTIYKMEI